jgi:hypothetical protein
MNHLHLIKISVFAAALACAGCTSTADSIGAPVSEKHPRPEVLTRGGGYLKNVIYYSVDLMEGTRPARGDYPLDTLIVRSEARKKSLVYALAGERLEDKTDVKEIPAFMRAFLDSLSDSGRFSIASPHEEWQEDGSKPGYCLPSRRLVYFGAGKKVALFSFHVSGYRLSQLVAILKFDHDKVTDFWFEEVPSTLNKPEELIRHLRNDRRNGGNC